MIKILKSNFKTISINALLLFLFLGLPPVLLFTARKIKTVFINGDQNLIDERAFYPTYSNKNFSIKLWSEFKRTRHEYVSFLGWRALPMKSEYTNITGRYNTRLSSGQSLNNSTWFFGGSTIWGQGSSDSGTIPSIYNQLTQQPVYNFGEQGYVSRQSLNQLLNLISDGHRPNSILFYEGVNDISHGCRKEYNRIPIHEFEKTISDSIKQRSNSASFFGLMKMSFKRILEKIVEPYALLIRSEAHSAKQFSDAFVCHKDLARSQLIAEHLVNNWYSAFLIAKAYDSQFYAILQPTLSTTKAQYGYFTSASKNKSEIMRKQIEAVYPLIISKIKLKCSIDRSFCSSFIDGRYWITSDSIVFVDFCHLTKEGNLMVVKNLINNM